MNDLTQQDRDNYASLRKAAIAWKNALHRLGDRHNLTKALITDLADKQLPEQVSSVDDLSDKITCVDSYLVVYQHLTAATTLTPEEKIGVSPVQQTFITELGRVKASLASTQGTPAVTTDSFCQDDLFFGFIEGEQARKWTQDLLAGTLPELNRLEIKALTSAWGNAIQKFVEDARNKCEVGGIVHPGKPETFSHFFCIRDELEGLYDKLSAVVT